MVRPHDGFCIFSEQRTGKCLPALMLVDERKPDVTIILCPKQVEGTWKEQLAEHLEIDWDGEVHIITYQSPVKDLQLRKYWYKWSLEFKKHGGTLMLIADEAQYLKKPGSAQSKFARTLAKRAKWRLAITGTPADKGYEQYWAVMDFIQHNKVFGTYKEFKDEFCIYTTMERRDGRAYPVLTGYRRKIFLRKTIRKWGYRITFDEAREAMGRKPVIIRRKKVYFDLEPKTRHIYEEMKYDMQVTLDDIEIPAVLPVTLIQKLQQICGGFLLHQSRVPGVRKRQRMVIPVGEEKMLKLLQICSGLNGRVVICCRFSHEIAAIRAKFTEMDWTHKEISGQEAWDGKFNVDFVILQVKSGVGFDLSKSNTYVFYSWDHSYITFEQSRFRIMSMAHTKQVNYYFLMARDTCEDEYYDAVNKKKDFATLVLDKHRQERESGKSEQYWSGRATVPPHRTGVKKTRNARQVR